MSLPERLEQLKAKYAHELSKEEALDLAIEAAKLHMQFLKLTTDKQEKVQLRDRFNKLVDKAEQIKTTNTWESNSDLLLGFGQVPAVASKLLRPPKNSRKLTTAEEILLLQGTKLHGFKFPRWESPPDDSEFQLLQSHDNVSLFLDETDIYLSTDQAKILDDWKRPSAALPPPTWILDPHIQIFPHMLATTKVDLVQDAATDCSVVASLAAAIARGQLGHPRLLSSIMYPYDLANECPRMSPNGKYVLRLNFNGCFRKVVVDDRLPVSKTKRILHVIDRSDSGLLWPALMEKAYLKVRGGYDFPGSNSGTDLWILTGWIPEQIFLQHEETNSTQLWPRMLKAFQAGDVMVTLGTGKMTERAEQQSGLTGLHGYAVLNLREQGQSRELLIKNPWLQGTSWKDHRNPEEQKDKAEVAGTFWMDLSDLMQYFESIYLNWNPGLFTTRQDIHFKWDLSPGSSTGRSAPGSFVNNPQYTVMSNTSGLIWLLLSRHITDQRNDASSQYSDSDEGFISLYAFENNGHRVTLSKDYLKRGLYVDSPQTLLQLDAEANTSYTVVVSEEDIPPSLHTFTLSIFGHTTFKLDPAATPYRTKTKQNSLWKVESAGGNVNCDTYSTNPQFSLRLPSASSVSLVLETLVPNTQVNCRLVYQFGERVFSVTPRDVIADSGNYSRGCAQALVDYLDAGTYTIICSTYEPGQLGAFSLIAESNTNHTVTLIPREGAGKLQIKFAPASFGNSSRILAAPIQPLRLARVGFKAKYIDDGVAHSLGGVRAAALNVHCATRLTVELGRGPDRKILSASAGGEFSDSPTGLRTEEVDISPALVKEETLWVVLERLAGCESIQRVEERLAVEMWADTIDCAKIGAWREFER